MIAEILIIPGDGAPEGAKSGAQYVARSLSAVGLKVREQISLCTDKKKLQQAVAAALGRSNIVITIGGMDRESAYLTKTVMADGLGLELVLFDEVLDAIKEYCQRTGERFLGGDDELARLPENCTPFPPSFGKTPGCVISSAAQHIVLLPEAQQELAAMMGRYVVPYLSGSEAAATVTHTIRTYGLPERAVREQLSDLTAKANPAVTVHKDGNEVVIRVSAQASDNYGAAALCTPVMRDIVARMGDAAYGLDVDSIQTAVVTKMSKKELGLAVCEAGTDGMLTRVLGETGGVQDILRFTTTADDEEAKAEKLSIPAKQLKKRGNVSEYAAVAMAAAVRERAMSDIGVAIAANTDDLGDPKSELGEAYIAVCDEEYVYVKKLVVGEGDADADVITDACLSRALNMVRLYVDYLPRRYPGSIPIADALKGKTVTDKENYDDDLPPDRDPGTGLAGNFIIRKADEPKEKVRKFIFILALLVFLGSGGYLGNYYFQSWRAAQQAERWQNMFDIGANDVELRSDFPPAYLNQFHGLWSINQDVVGFLWVDDTQVAYPVVQTPDAERGNDYYLRRDFLGNSNNHGIPFMDWRADLERPSDNMIIYGHNMKDGQIFGELLDYRTLDYYKEHPVIDFTTLYEEGRYKIFSTFITNAYEAQGPVFAYHDFVDAQSTQDFTNFVDQLYLRSLINTNVDVQPGDKLLTLSTCTYEFQDARFVIVARKVRPGESAEVETETAVLNPTPLYPDIWYSLFGGTKPYVPEVNVVTTPTTNRPLNENLGIAPLSANSPTSSSAAGSGSSSSHGNTQSSSSQSSASSEAAAVQAAAQSSAAAAPAVSTPESSTAEGSTAAAEKAAADKAAADKAAAEKAAADKAAADKAAADKAAADKAAADKAAADKAAADKAAADKAAADKASEQSAADVAARQRAEGVVTAALSDAQSAAKMAQNAAASAGKADFSDHAQSEWQAAQEAAALAEEAAKKAAEAAEKIGTESAQLAASKAQDAVSDANTAVKAAKAAYQALQAEEKSGSTSSERASSASRDSDRAADKDDDDEADYNASHGAGTLTVMSGGKKVTGDAVDIVARIVQNELGSSFHQEAVKAQAVAAYTYILHESKKGTPTVSMASSATAKVKAQVADVIGQAVYYNGKVAFTPYHATSAGATTSSRDVWGGNYPYLTSVESPHDTTVTNYKYSAKMNADKAASLLKSKLGIDTSDWDPEDWFEVLSEAEGGYNGEMSVCGKTKSKSGNKITGRMIREALGLRSAYFTWSYDAGSDKFTFTTYGYGHGVGMSQNGANLFASRDGWDYINILEHYYPGCTVN